MGKLICAGLIIAAFVLGIYVGRMPIMSLILGGTPTETQKTLIEDMSSSTPTSTTNGTVINTSNLSAGQQKLLSTLGINASEIMITAEMIACAEAKVGATRLKEIEGGATPSFTEGLSLLSCYK